MRIKTLLLGLLLLGTLNSKLSAQDEPLGMPLSVGYYGHYAFQPGIKIGTELPVISNRDTENQSKHWFISPQLGLFSDPENDINYIINLEGGIKKKKKGKNSYSSYSLGLGYRLQSKLQSFTVTLGNGDTGNKQRTSSNFLMPTLNYEYGWATNKKVSWFSKYSIGSSFFGGRERSLHMFIELGIKFSINKTVK